MKPSLKTSLLLRITAISFVSIACISIASVYMEYSHFRKDAFRTREEYLVAQKQLIQSEVTRTIDYIDYMRGSTESRLCSSIKSRVYEAHAIATHILNRFKEGMTDEEIAGLIRETLRPIRFNKGRGYYFIADLEERVILLPINPAAEGTDLSDWHDQDGTYVLRTASEIARQKTEGFFEYRWPKPGMLEKQFRKISFVKHFEPFDWYIGTGEYIDDVAADIQAEVVERLEKVRFGEDGYIFAGQWDGRSLIGPAKGKNMWDVTDVNGVKIVQHLIAAARQGGGFVEYVLPPFADRRHTDKISFATAVPEWQWYVGAGVYVDTIEDRIANLKGELDRRLVRYMFLFGLLFVILVSSAFLVSKRLADQVGEVVESFLDFFKAAKDDKARIDPELQSYAEFVDLAAAGNAMAERRERAETALRQSEAQFRSAFNSESVGMALIGRDTTFIRINDRLCRTLGYSSEELLGRSFNDFTHPEDRTGGDDRVRRLISGEDRYNSAEKRYLHKAGHVVWALVSNALVSDAAGEPQLIVSYLLDITERKQMEMRVMQEKNFSESVLNSLPDAFYMFDTSGKMRRWNHSLEIVSGYTSEEVAQMSALDFIAGQYREITFQAIEEVFEAGESSVESAFQTKIGEEIPYLLTGKRIEIEGITYLCGMGVNIIELKRAEEALRKSEERYREIVEGTDNLVTEVDPEGRFTFVNEASRKIFGLEPKDCVGRLAFDFVYPDDREKTLDHFTRWVKEKAHSVTFENRQASRSGQARDMLWSIKLHFDAAGEINSIKSIARDITERKRAEEELARYRDHLEELVEERTAALRRTNDNLQREIIERKRIEAALRDSETRLAEILDFLPDATLVIDRDGRVQLWNRTMEEMTGINAADILGKGKYEYAIPFYGKRRPMLVDLVMQRDKLFEEKYLHIKEVGDRLVGEAHTPNLGLGGVYTWGYARPLYDARGDVVGAIESVRDITERKRAEDALRESEERHRVLLEASPDPVTVYDPQGDVLYVNPAFEKTFGWRLEEFEGRQIDFVPPHEKKKTREVVERTLAGVNMFLETQRLTSSGDTLDIQISTSSFYDSAGNLAGTIVISRDITPQKQVEEALRQYADTQTVLVREVNHRVKNNLSAIIGMLHMEQDRAEVEGLTSYIPVLGDLVGRIEGLSTVHSLLSASGWRPLEVGELCRQVVDAALQGVPLGKRIDVKLSPSRVRINSNQAHHLTLVVNELTTNTVKYAMEHRDVANIFIEIDQSDHILEILFKDDGPGFPDHILRNDSVSSSIGFELIRGITRQSLGGEIDFKNDQGAVVRMRFENELEAEGGAS